MSRRSIGGATRLGLRIYAVMVLALASVVAVIVFGRSRREPAPFPRRTAVYIIESLARDRGDLPTLRAELARLGRETSLKVTMYRPDGQLLGSTEEVPPPPLPEHARPSSPSGGPREAVVPLSGGDYAILSIERRPQGPDFRVDIALVLLSLGIAALVLSSMIGRPLAQIAAAARQFGGGDLAARARLARRDELGALARTFDEMADRLTSLMRTQRELLASISHELRTPLARIRVALDLASEGDAESARESLRDIAGDLAELEELVGDVLAMARLDAQGAGEHGIPRLRRQEVDGRALVERAAARFRTLHPERTLELALAPAGALTIAGDPNLLRRVLENLLENAHKYSQHPSVLRVEAARHEGDAVFSVIDAGQGIAAADLPRVFEPFFRADRSRTRGTGGVGLGLALSKRVVEAHGGTISIESEVDRGTRVWFAVPLAGNIS